MYDGPKNTLHVIERPGQGEGFMDPYCPAMVTALLHGAISDGLGLYGQSPDHIWKAPLSGTLREVRLPAYKACIAVLAKIVRKLVHNNLNKKG